ncbi:MAG: Mut7-C RNAse domain-containing protein [Deltaproteobacteria bacterium]|nr:Mut7-C RNAse domain-containing protein [Deltaproteobacteria bacterium]
MRFIADRNLGRLVKWLRIMGYDTVLYRGPVDRLFLRKAEREGRTVLTRVRDMARRQFSGSLIVVEDDRLENQLKALMDRLPIRAETERLFTRCLRCNEPLQEATREEVAGLVPSYVLETQSRFRLCPNCRGIFWPGTHRKNIHRFLGMNSPVDPL